MAAIGNIRKHYGLLVVIVGIALLAFVLGDLFRSTNRRQPENVATVDGEKITHKDYSNMVNMNLENAITYAEQLFINLYSIFEAQNISSKIGIGISTRSMRLVPGNRLISEAEQAAQKALDEETMPIVAFKVNHEKYREYVSDEA